MAETELQFLRQKIREQATRLQDLEKFRRLSEQALPGQFPAPNASLPLAQLQDRYASLYSRMHEVLNDNSALEESLRAEVLESEHQRAYIEVLKQALEVKSAELGLNGSAEDYSQFALLKTDSEGTRKEFIRMQNLLKQKESKVAQLQVTLSELQTSTGQRDQVQTDLRASQTQLQEAEARVKQLEEEKQSLLDYAEQRSRLEERFKQLSDSNGQLKKMYEKLQEECSTLEARNAVLEKDLKDVDSLRSECGRLTSENRDLQQQLQDARNRLETLQLRTAELTGNKKKAELDVKAFGEQVEALTQQRDMAQGRFESTKEALQTAEGELGRALQQVSTLGMRQKEREMEIHQLKSDCEKLELALKRGQMELKDTQNEYEMALVEQRKAKGTAELQVKTLLDQLETQRCECASLFSQLQDSRTQIRELKSEISQAQSALKSLERARSTEEQLRKELLEARRTLAEYRQEILTLSHDRTALQYKLLDTNTTR